MQQYESMPHCVLPLVYSNIIAVLASIARCDYIWKKNICMQIL